MWSALYIDFIKLPLHITMLLVILLAIIKRPLVSFEIYFTPLRPSLIYHKVTALTVAEVYCLHVYSAIADCKNGMKYITLDNLRECLIVK